MNFEVFTDENNSEFPITKIKISSFSSNGSADPGKMKLKFNLLEGNDAEEFAEEMFREYAPFEEEERSAFESEERSPFNVVGDCEDLSNYIDELFQNKKISLFLRVKVQIHIELSKELDFANDTLLMSKDRYIQWLSEIITFQDENEKGKFFTYINLLKQYGTIDDAQEYDQSYLVELYQLYEDDLDGEILFLTSELKKSSHTYLTGSWLVPVTEKPSNGFKQDLMEATWKPRDDTAFQNLLLRNSLSVHPEPQGALEGDDFLDPEYDPEDHPKFTFASESFHLSFFGKNSNPGDNASNNSEKDDDEYKYATPR